jgi:hypothetical protein
VPPAVRTRAVPHLAAMTLTPGMALVTHQVSVPGIDRQLWLRMRRMLPPAYWRAWLAVPRHVRLPNGGPPVQNFYALSDALHRLADFLELHDTQVTVGQGALWSCALTALPAHERAQRVVDWYAVRPDGHGWLPAAAGFSPDEYAARPLPDRVLTAMATLRGQRLPESTAVPGVASADATQAA